MKTFRVQLNTSGPAFVEADTWMQQDGLHLFYRAESLVASYPVAWVQSVTEISPSGPTTAETPDGTSSRARLSH
jgi:hypothetical protein